MQPQQNLSQFKVNPSSRGRSAFYVQLWWLVQQWLIHPSPQFMYGWRRFLWRSFGAKVGKNVIIRPRARVTYPWKVTIGDYSWIGDEVELYSLDDIHIGSNTVISQHSYICSASHDYEKTDFPIISAPVNIEDEVWIATGTMVMPGVTIGKGTIVGARSLVLKDLPEQMICAGHPAKVIKERQTTQHS